jgi:pimeloyl-ACP methyl ester carboxylesterase
MDDGNREEFSLAIEGGAAHTRLLEKQAPELADMQPQPLDAQTRADPSASDIIAFREFVPRSLRRGLASGIHGWRDDDLALMRPWGFDLAAITCPPAIWQGETDRLVPPQHGHWLAAHVPRARAHFDPERGHGVLFRVHFREIVADLADLAASSRR